MKRFLTKLSGFSLVAAGFSLSLLLVVITLNRFAIDEYCDLDDRVDAALVGDSHIMWSIDTSAIENVENIAYNAEGYVYTYYKLRHLLRKDPNIRHVYLGFGYHNLSGYYDDYVFGFLSRNFVHRYVGIVPFGELSRLILRSPRNAAAAFKAIVLQGGRSGLRQACPIYGSFPNEMRTETFHAPTMQTRISEQYYDDEGNVINVSEINLEYLDKIIALLREYGVRITVVNTPLHSDYIDLIPTEYSDLYREYISRNQLEAYEFEGIGISDSEFLPDGDHVNYTGAILATERFRKYHENSR